MFVLVGCFFAIVLLLLSVVVLKCVCVCGGGGGGATNSEQPFFRDKLFSNSIVLILLWVLQQSSTACS